MPTHRRKTLAERLQEKFGGEIESQWGTPDETNIRPNLRADIIRVRKPVSYEEIDEVTVAYFADWGLTPSPNQTPRDREFGNHFVNEEGTKNFVAAYTYHKELAKIIVSASVI